MIVVHGDGRYDAYCIECACPLEVSKCHDCEGDAGIECDTCEGYGFLDDGEPCDPDEMTCHSCYYAEHW